MIWPDDKLTRFEVSRIISARALQIALGAPILIKTDKTDPSDIAEQEFREIKIPMTIKRTMPDGQVIVVDIKAATKNWLKEN